MLTETISIHLNGYANIQFRAARKTAEEVGAQIVLGDRPIEITVSTFLVMYNWEKFNFLGMTFSDFLLNVLNKYHF